MLDLNNSNSILMKFEDIIWDEPTKLYVIIINSFVKFGITRDWKRREKEYYFEFKKEKFELIEIKNFPNRWQAELIEQVVKWRIKKFIINGRHEWTELPIQTVLDIINSSVLEIKDEYNKHEYIHKKGKIRWDYYRQIAQFYFKINTNEFFQLNSLPLVDLFVNTYSEKTYGKASYDIILKYNEFFKEITNVYKNTTIHRIELLALIKGISQLKKRSNLVVFTNSKYIFESIHNKRVYIWEENNWSMKKHHVKNVDLWKLFLELSKNHTINVQLVNGTVDEIGAKNAIDIYNNSTDFVIDVEYQKEFENKDKFESKVLMEGSPCKNCKTPLIKKLPKHKKIKADQKFYYDYYYYCKNCKKMYFTEDAKVFL